MKGLNKKRLRRESAIILLGKQISAHEANNEFVSRILKDKNLTKTSEEIERIRKKKLERAKTCLENTKKNLHK